MFRNPLRRSQNPQRLNQQQLRTKPNPKIPRSSESLAD
jgi:hypothetical protein